MRSGEQMRAMESSLARAKKVFAFYSMKFARASGAMATLPVREVTDLAQDAPAKQKENAENGRNVVHRASERRTMKRGLFIPEVLIGPSDVAAAELSIDFLLLFPSA